MAFDVDQVRKVAERVAASRGLEVVEVELRGGGKARMLRIVIDRIPVPGESAQTNDQAEASGQLSGVTHEDCANMSREVGTILDVEDVIPGASYTLEVSSPGLDRRLTQAADYERFRGSLVKLSTRQEVNGNRHFEGRLEAFHDGWITLDVGGARKKKMRPAEGEPQKLEIDFANVEKANLVPEF
jgi:ribosome maturation factor RimP